MIYRNWRQPKLKDHDFKKRNSKHGIKHKDEMKSAKSDEKNLKRKKKRLTIDWFFRPNDD